MQPFSVTCETCGARLKVRDESLVGEIHSCPRCASMVLIMLPAESELTSSPPAKAVAPSSGAELAGTPRSQSPDNDFAAQIDGLLQQGAASDTSESLTDPPAKEALGEAALTTGASSSVVLWGVISATTLSIIAMAGAAWWFSGESSTELPVATSQLEASVDAPSLVPTPTSADTNAPVPTEPVDDATPSPESEPQPTEVQKPEIAPADPSLALPPVTVTEFPPPAPAEEEQEEAEAEDPTSSNQPPVTSTPAEAPPSLPSFIDPLGIDPADLDLLLVPNRRAPSTDPPEAKAEPHEELNPVVAVIDAPLAQPQQKRRFDPGSAAIGPSFAEQGPSTPLAIRLGARIPSIRWSNTPLHRVVSELSQLSGVTIQIDPDTLRMAPARANYPISLSQQDATVESIVAQLAKSLQLEVVVVGDLLYLTKGGADATREVSYPVDDLVTGEAATQGLVRLIEQFALEAPGAAEIQAAGGQVVIRQPARHQYDVLLFLERLRKSRGLAPRMRYPAELVSAEPRLLALEDKLARSTTFAIVEWTPLTDVVDFWQHSSGVAILLDWRELATIDRRPSSTLMASADQLPWGQALDSCLLPLEMAWIPIDGEAIQLTSREAAHEHRWVEFYPAADLAELAPRSRTAEGLRELLADKCDPQSVGSAVIAGDPAGKQLVVRANRAIHQAILDLRDDS